MIILLIVLLFALKENYLLTVTLNDIDVLTLKGDT